MYTNSHEDADRVPFNRVISPCAGAAPLAGRKAFGDLSHGIPSTNINIVPNKRLLDASRGKSLSH